MHSSSIDHRFSHASSRGSNASGREKINNLEYGPPAVMGVAIGSLPCGILTPLIISRMTCRSMLDIVGYEGLITVNLPFNEMLSGEPRRVQALVFKSPSKTNGKAIYVDDVEFATCTSWGGLVHSGTGLLQWDMSTSAHWRPSGFPFCTVISYWLWLV
ncbi:hypothetical protein BJ742DRAFT_805961 [Cladochytrium replicatum]|nr:hypothetical protein BJ742DRAFT_805961 [Cladochytrium replicatum]